jgi:ribosome-associated heat shock protein Hsp15
MNEDVGRQRIDKWLWFARLAKSRSIAQKLVTGGKVRVNRDKIDASSRLVRPGDVLTITFERQVRILRILAPGHRRGPAPEAQSLYDDITPAAEPSAVAPLVQRGGPRPTKRDRRVLDAFHSGTQEARGENFPDDDED